MEVRLSNSTLIPSVLATHFYQRNLVEFKTLLTLTRSAESALVHTLELWSADKSMVVVPPKPINDDSRSDI